MVLYWTKDRDGEFEEGMDSFIQREFNLLKYPLYCLPPPNLIPHPQFSSIKIKE